jgi:hypothetical protein
MPGLTGHLIDENLIVSLLATIFCQQAFSFIFGLNSLASVEDYALWPLRSQNHFWLAQALTKKNRDCSTRPSHEC